MDTSLTEEELIEKIWQDET